MFKVGCAMCRRVIETFLYFLYFKEIPASHFKHIKIAQVASTIKLMNFCKIKYLFL